LRDAWATWNPQRAAAKQLEEAVRAGTMTLQVGSGCRLPVKSQYWWRPGQVVTGARVPACSPPPPPHMPPQIHARSPTHGHALQEALQLSQPLPEGGSCREAAGATQDGRPPFQWPAPTPPGQPLHLPSGIHVIRPSEMTYR
jgi:hypothetical protein